MSTKWRSIGVKVIRRLTADNACVWMATGDFSSFARSQSQTEEDDTAGKQSSPGSVVHRERIVGLLLSGPIACRSVTQAQLEKREVRRGSGAAPDQTGPDDGWLGPVHGRSCRRRLCFAHYGVMTDARQRPADRH